MRTGRPKQPLTVTEEERERLQSLAHRSRSKALLARRGEWCWPVPRVWTKKQWRRSCDLLWA
jgi:hypothetical protein